MIRIPGHTTRAAVTPFVGSRFVRKERINSYRDRVCAKFLSGSSVDDEILKIHNQLSIDATGRPIGTESKKLQEGSNADPHSVEEDERLFD